MPIVIPKEPETLSARDLLSEYNTIKIPDYQRHYTWETENVKQFFDDIIDDANQFGPHNLLGRSARTSVFGTIIGMLELKEGLNDSNHYRDYNFIIIDGQQRVTTLNFLILCLCSFTKKFSKDIPALIQIFSDMRNYLVRNSELSNPSPRLLLNYTDREYWNKIIRVFFTPNTDTEMNFENTIKEMSTFLRIS